MSKPKQKTVTIKTEVSCCQECPNVTNSYRLHDDPFTSSPSSNTWYCTNLKGERGGSYTIQDPTIVDINCSFLKKREMIGTPCSRCKTGVYRKSANTWYPEAEYHVRCDNCNHTRPKYERK